MGLLTGKRILIAGIASKRSIAWGIAESMHKAGAELAFTYQNDRLKDRVIGMAKECGSDIVLPCDVGSDTDIEHLFELLGEKWEKFDGLVHSIAFAPRDQLDGDYLDCITREGFNIAHEVSSYSFAAMAKAARPRLNDGASLLTMSYLGAVRAMPNYNVMGVAKASLEANTRFMAQSLGVRGIRVNAISAGPIKTLASAGIGNFKKLLNYVASVSPLKTNVTIQQVGDTASFLCSDMSAGITGQIIYVDAGYNIMSSPAELS